MDWTRRPGACLSGPVYSTPTTFKWGGTYERTGSNYLTELNGRVTQESLAEEQEFYLKHGYITTRLDPATMIDPSFGEDAVRILGRADE